MNQTKGNKRSRFFALLMAGVLSAASLSAQTQNRTIKGCITDANNKEPLMGATITLDGGKTGAVTDLDGNYTLVVPAGTKQITVSYIGYIAKTVQLNGDVINITRLQRPSVGRGCGGGLWYRTQERSYGFGGNCQCQGLQQGLYFVARAAHQWQGFGCSDHVELRFGIGR